MAVFYQRDEKTDDSEIAKILRDDFTYLKDENLYVDQKFPADNSSIGTEKFCRKYGTVTWLRPKDIMKITKNVREPEFFVGGPSRSDVNQGHLGDCWFLAAVAGLTMNEDLLYRVVPKDQSFQEDYNGTFHFRFWQFGTWTDVVVDDFLPTRENNHGEIELIGLHSAVDNEFWPALLEKAYAKFYGSYQALGGGFFSEAAEDFTGGVSEMYSAYSDRREDLYEVLLEAWGENALMGCDFKTYIDLRNDDNEIDNEVYEVFNYRLKDASDTHSGLIKSHAYSITQVGYVYRGTENPEKIRILRLRNPWGDGHEWKGPWSDHSNMWDSVSEEEKERLQWKNKKDGEFWMSFEDFNHCYLNVEICHFKLNDFSDSANKKKWEMSEFQGAWVPGATAGGCKCDPEKFYLNPQYRMTLEKESTVLVVLMQEHRRTKNLKGSGYRRIGLSIYPLKGEPSTPLDSEFFENATAIELDSYMDKESAFRSLQYAGNRDVSFRLKLKPGVYFIIPSAIKSSIEEKYLLRVFSDNKSTVEEYDQVLRSPSDEDLDEKFHKEKFNKKELSVIVATALGDEASSLTPKDWKKLFDRTMYDDESYTGHGFSESNCESIVTTMQFYKDNADDTDSYFKRFMILAKVFNDYADNDVALMEPHHLRSAFNEAGYTLDNRTLCELVRLSKSLLTFDDFYTYAFELGGGEVH